MGILLKLFIFKLILVKQFKLIKIIKFHITFNFMLESEKSKKTIRRISKTIEKEICEYIKKKYTSIEILYGN